MARRRWIGLPGHSYGCKCDGCVEYGEYVGERQALEESYDAESERWGA